MRKKSNGFLKKLIDSKQKRENRMSLAENVGKVKALIEGKKIIPVLVLPDLKTGLKVCEILVQNLLPIAEITFRTSAAAEIIREVSRNFSDMLIGAGTVLNIKDLRIAVDAGAKFAVSPGTNPRILEEAQKLQIPFFPGVSNASDIESALEFSCKTLKFFPAEPLGGLKMLKALSAPYRHLGMKYIPLGGISVENMGEYLAFPDVLAVGGSWLAPRELIEQEDWNKINKNIADVLREIREVKEGSKK
jgi:2-dehydro-3-deoxyphosphogluconate aldolase/(4S)-4-hydroxy-2-oxoglutarate aldolase